ncbi:MAG: hypothetical protein PSX79_10220 [bacterium]|nr:hypothetical protein [bacterium]
MKKFVALAALITVSAAIAAPASAASLVRVSLANKSDAQISSEIKAAAQTVCANEQAGFVSECVNVTVLNANRQLNSIIKARTAPKAISRSEAVSVVRVSLKGKSADQIQTEIRSAAQQVCKADNTTRYDYNLCVGVTIRSAKAQMQAMNAGQAKIDA